MTEVIYLPCVLRRLYPERPCEEGVASDHVDHYLLEGGAYLVTHDPAPVYELKSAFRDQLERLFLSCEGLSIVPLFEKEDLSLGEPALGVLD
jgi:hypothetical protein